MTDHGDGSCGLTPEEDLRILNWWGLRDPDLGLTDEAGCSICRPDQAKSRHNRRQPYHSGLLRVIGDHCKSKTVWSVSAFVVGGSCQRALILYPATA